MQISLGVSSFEFSEPELILDQRVIESPSDNASQLHVIVNSLDLLHNYKGSRLSKVDPTCLD